ncbi:MAG: outer membrane protein, partial [Halorhodospira sp.]
MKPRRAVLRKAGCLGLLAMIPTWAGAQLGTDEGLFDPNLPFEGRYIGLQGGMLMPSVSMSAEVDDLTIAGQNFKDTQEVDLSFGTEAIGSRMDLFGGVGFQAESLYYGAEANFTLGHAMDADALEAIDGVEGEVSGGYGISARLGGVLEEGTSMIYGRAGYQVRDLEIEVDDGSGDPESDSSSFAGLGLGAGLEYRSTQLPILMRVEGVWYNYSDEGFFSGSHEVSFSETNL